MCFCLYSFFFFFFKQKTAYEMRISDWSSDVCSSDLLTPLLWMQRKPSSKKQAACHEPIRFLQVSRPFAGAALDMRSAAAGSPPQAHGIGKKIGRASCRERVCQYV